MKKSLWPISSRIIEHDKRQGTTYKGPQVKVTINVEIKRSFLQNPRGCWKHKFLKKKAIFPVKKRVWHFSSRIIEHDKGQRTTYKVPQGNLTINVEVIRNFLHDPRGCWKHTFLKKKAIFSVKKRLSPISSRFTEHDKGQGSAYKVPQGNLTINVEVITPFLQDPRGCWKHKFLKNKAKFPVEKRFSPISSRITEHDKRQGTTYKVPQGNLTINVEVIRPFLLDPRGCWKHKFFKSKAIFPVEKRFSPISSRIIEHDKRPETTYKGRQFNLTINVEVKRSFLQEPRGSWKHKFLKKKATFPVKRRFSPISSHVIEHYIRPETIYKGPQGNLTINVEVRRSYLQDPRGCWKHKFLKKKANFPVKKRFSPIPSRIIEHDKGQGTAYKVPQGNLTFNVEVIRPFLQDPRGCWKHKFLKNKATIPVKKRFYPILSRIIECDNPQGTIQKAPKRITTITVEAIRSFF